MTVPDVAPLRLAASFAAGFAVVAVVTTLADIFGEGPAGFLGGLPSTGPIGLLSIGITQSTQAAVQATTLFPLGFAVTFAFLLFYTFPARLGFWARMPLALGLWLLAAVAVSIWSPDDFALSVSASAGVSLVVLCLRWRIRTERTKHFPTATSYLHVILRGTLGGSVVAAAVILSAVAGPLVGGVFAAAPAVWSSSIYVTNQAHGVQFTRSLTWPFMQTGILTVIPYAIAARYFFSVEGVLWGTILAYVCMSPFAYVAWWLTNRRNGSSDSLGLPPDERPLAKPVD
jgi:Protein of unknown function (DUF3147)